MKEYTIYIRHSNACPYTTKIYKSFDEALSHLYDIILLEKERNRPYYVDNDFFENIYSQSETLKYLCIKEREVEDWQKYSKNNFTNYNNKKIIYLNYHKL